VEITGEEGVGVMANIESIPTTQVRLSRFFYAVSAVVLLAFAFWFDIIANGREFLFKEAPQTSDAAIARSFVLVLAAIFAYFAVKPIKINKPDVFYGRMPGWLTGAALLASIGGVLITKFVLALNPSLLDIMLPEIQPIGLTLESLLGVATVIFLLTIFKAIGVGRGSVAFFPAPLIVGSIFLVVFVILMEELSWGQRIFGWGTADIFAGNDQSETNLHNFYTNRFEVAYYSAAMILFVIVPVFWRREWPGLLKSLRFYIPPPVFALIGFPLCVLNYEYWNILPMQFMFYLGILSIGYLAIGYIGVANRLAALSFMVLALGVATGFAALYWGNLMTIGHELTEIREGYIMVLILVYSIWLYRKFAAGDQLNSGALATH